MTFSPYRYVLHGKWQRIGSLRVNWIGVDEVSRFSRTRGQREFLLFMCCTLEACNAHHLSSAFPFPFLHRHRTRIRILGFVPAILATFALLTGLLASFWCQTVQYVPFANATTPDLPILYFGPWLEKAITTDNAGGEAVQVGPTCVPFPEGTYLDPKQRVAQAFGIVATLLGAAVTVALWIGPLRPGSFGPCRWQGLGRCVMTFQTLFQGLTFYALDSKFCTDNPIVASLGWSNEYGSCQWGPGTTCNVISTVLWYVTGTVMCYLIDAPQRTADPSELSPPEASAVAVGTVKSMDDDDNDNDDGFTESA